MYKFLFTKMSSKFPTPKKVPGGFSSIPPSPGISRTPQRLVGIRRCAQGLLQCSQVAVPRRLLEVLGHLGVKGIHHQRQTWAGLWEQNITAP